MLPVYVKDQEYHLPSDPVYFLAARDGLYLVKQNRFFRSVTSVPRQDLVRIGEIGVALPQRERTDLLPQAEEVVATFPPISAEILEQVVTFFAGIARTHGTEAVALLYYDLQTERYQVIVPRQSATEIHATYTGAATPAGLQRVGTLHSHVGDVAFHSEIDLADEETDDGLHIVVGLGGEHRSLACVLVVDGRRCPLAPETLFDRGWELALAASGEESSAQMGAVTPADPAGPARRAIEARYGALGTGRRVLLIEGRLYSLSEVMLALGLAFEDNRAIDAVEVLEDRLYMVRYFDGETRQVVALEFDTHFRYLQETRAHIAEWMGDDYYDFPWSAWCPWTL